MRKIAYTIRDFRDPEGSGGDARRTSYTLPPSQNAPPPNGFRLILCRFGGRRAFHYAVCNSEPQGLGRCCLSLLVHDVGEGVCRYIDSGVPE
jgi:hypothetical protein